MPTCDFFSSANHYQSHVRSFGKVPKIFRNFLDSVDFIFDYFARCGILGLLGFCYELRCARIGGLNKGRFCNTIALVALVHTSVQSD